MSNIPFTGLRLVTGVPVEQATDVTLILNALHYAYHMGYLTQPEVIKALGPVDNGRGMLPEQYLVYYFSWAERHGVPPRADAATPAGHKLRVVNMEDLIASSSGRQT